MSCIVDLSNGVKVFASNTYDSIVASMALGAKFVELTLQVDGKKALINCKHILCIQDEEVGGLK